MASSAHADWGKIKAWFTGKPTPNKCLQYFQGRDLQRLQTNLGLHNVKELPLASETQTIHNLFEIFKAFQNGLEPDLTNRDQRILFEAYLKSKFGNPSNTEISKRLESELPSLYRNIGNVTKTVFARAFVKKETAVYAVTPELESLTKQMLKKMGKIKSNLLEIEANLGYWAQLLNISEQDIPQEQLAQLTKDQIHDLREKNRSDFLKKLNEFIPESTRQKIRNSELGPKNQIKELLTVLFEIKKRSFENNIDIESVHLAIQDASALLAFMDANLITQMKSNDGMLRIQALQQALQIRDALALELFKKHFSEVALEYSTKLAPGIDVNFEQTIQAQLKLVQASAPSVTQSESYTVRQTSIAESGFRSCLGGSDCSSNTYFSFALEPSVHYFTMTDYHGFSSGHMTIILGTAGKQKVAFMDKLQNVSFDRSLYFIETVRRILANSGYKLAMQPTDTGHISGLSNDTALTQYLFNNLKTRSRELGSFSPETTPTQMTGYSRILLSPTVFEILPMQAQGIELLPAAKPYRIEERISADQILAQTVELKNGTYEDKVRFMAIGPVLADLHILTLADYINILENWMFSADSSIKLKYQATYHRFILTIRKNHDVVYYPSTNVEALKDLIFKMTPQDALQIYSQLSQRKDMSWLDANLKLSFLFKNPKKFNQYLSSLSPSQLESILSSNLRKIKLSENDMLIRSAIFKRFLEIADIPKFLAEDANFLSGKFNVFSTLGQILGQASLEDAVNVAYWYYEKLQPQTVMNAKVFAKLLDEQIRAAFVSRLRDQSHKFKKSYDYVPSRSCFPGDMKVAAKYENIPIQLLKPGQGVASFNHQTEQVEIRKINAVRTHAERNILTLTLESGRVIRATPEHPFYRPTEHEYASTSELYVGDYVQTLNGQFDLIEKIESQKEKEDVYNIEVDHNHNYFIEEILVHNARIKM